MQKWAEIIGQARQSVEFLKDQVVARAVLNILQVCSLFSGWFFEHLKNTCPCITVAISKIVLLKKG